MAEYKPLTQEDLHRILSDAVIDYYNKKQSGQAIEIIEDIPDVEDWLPGLLDGLVEVLAENDRRLRVHLQRVAFASGGRRY